MIMHFMINAYHESLDFEIPEYFDDRKCSWKRWIDTGLESPHDIEELPDAPVVPGRYCSLLPHSVSVLLDFKGH
jgi:glycogen operon protein